MKKVRFETPERALRFTRMNDSECHSPRPFVERQIPSKPPELPKFGSVLTYSNDPVPRFECSNSSPYPIANKTWISVPHAQEPLRTPSNELELSMFDASSYELRQTCKPILKTKENRTDVFIGRKTSEHNQPVLLTVENKTVNPPNVLTKDNDFFIRRENLDKFCSDVNPLQNNFKRLNLGKENEPLATKAEMMRNVYNSKSPGHFGNQLDMQPTVVPSPVYNQECTCHHCVKIVKHAPQQNILKRDIGHIPHYINNESRQRHSHCPCISPQINICSHCDNNMPSPTQHPCSPYNCNNTHPYTSPQSHDAVDKKKWAVEKYEQSRKECTDIEKQTNLVKEKREPTVSDLFKIIKLQNEQLQILQEKVDKFISGAQSVPVVQPVPNCTTEHIALENNKISIGVMTSFEMVRTSTIINKEVLKQTNENSQVQCNRSQISIKEVVSKTQPVNLNFLDGIIPVEKASVHNECAMNIQADNVDEKTVNELSLCNIQMDNATTPLMSPEQSLYLDVRDYSDSEADSDDQSNVGWTYYNKVMTHVNGVLQDSDMPSSASALYRNTRKHCVQMQIDKTNVSVTKRVKFGDDPLGIHQPHIYASSTDTSLKMNQLAAKYLKGGASQLSHRPAPKPSTAPIDMSYATRNYMERHKLLQGTSRSPPPGEIPRFLDITALKLQPKLL